MIGYVTQYSLWVLILFKLYNFNKIKTWNWRWSHAPLWCHSVCFKQPVLGSDAELRVIIWHKMAGIQASVYCTWGRALSWVLINRPAKCEVDGMSLAVQMCEDAQTNAEISCFAVRWTESQLKIKRSPVHENTTRNDVLKSCVTFTGSFGSEPKLQCGDIWAVGVIGQPAG